MFLTLHYDTTNSLQGSGTVLFVNLLFSMLALFHLAYLGVMFGAQSEVDDSLQYKVNINTG